MSDVYSELRVRTIVKEEIASSPLIEKLSAEVYRIGVMLEDNSSKLDAALELVSSYRPTAALVKWHEERITLPENTQKLLVDTVAAHSTQLKAT